MDKRIFVRSKTTGYCFRVWDEPQFHNQFKWEIITKEEYFKYNNIKRG